MQAAPDLQGDKTTRLRSQTAKIEEGFALFPKEAHWLDSYLLELVSFPNAKNDDQVDSTVFALAWITASAEPAAIKFVKAEVARIKNAAAPQNGRKRVWVKPGPTHWQVSTGEYVLIPEDRIIEVPDVDAGLIIHHGGRRVD